MLKHPLSYMQIAAEFALRETLLGLRQWTTCKSSLKFSTPHGALIGFSSPRYIMQPGTEQLELPLPPEQLTFPFGEPA